MLKFSFALAFLIASFALLSAQAQPEGQKRGISAVSGVITLNGKPARGVSVALTHQDKVAEKEYYSRTDENGRFKIAQVADGQYWINAVAPDHFSSGYENGEWLRYGGQLLDLTKGKKIENISLELRRGGAITGRINDSQGNPLIDTDENGSFIFREDRPKDEPKFYRFYGLAPGTYVVFTRSDISGPFPVVEEGLPYAIRTRDSRYVFNSHLHSVEGARTYHPSSRRETATLVVVTGRDEVGGIDIRYRKDRSRR